MVILVLDFRPTGQDNHDKVVDFAKAHAAKVAPELEVYSPGYGRLALRGPREAAESFADFPAPHGRRSAHWTLYRLALQAREQLAE